jgi:hypothetical protein
LVGEALFSRVWKLLKTCEICGAEVSLFVSKILLDEYIGGGNGLSARLITPRHEVQRRSDAGFYEVDFTRGRDSVQLKVFIVLASGCGWVSNN